MLTKADAVLHRRSFLLAGTVLTQLSKAVEPGRPSKTSLMTAVARAIANRDPDPETRCPDAIAGRLMRREDLNVLTGSSHATLYEMAWDEILKKESAAGRYPYLPVTLRTKYIDAKIRAAATEGLDELVILGAGLDSRAYRMTSELDKVRIFEIDFPPTQEDKKQRVRAVLGRLPENVNYVGIDFAKQTLEDVLATAGHQAKSRALFLMEGVSMYLSAEPVSSTLHFVSNNSAPGGGIIFDYYDSRLFDGEGQTPLFKANMAMYRSWGEPHTFGIPGYQAQQFIEQHGLRLKSDYTFGELCALQTPRLNPALLDYRRLYFRIAHAVV